MLPFHSTCSAAWPFLGHVAALVRSHTNGLQPFESTIEQITETMPLAAKTITATTMIKQNWAAYDSCCTTETQGCS